MHDGSISIITTPSHDVGQKAEVMLGQKAKVILGQMQAETVGDIKTTVEMLSIAEADANHAHATLMTVSKQVADNPCAAASLALMQRLQEFSGSTDQRQQKRNQLRRSLANSALERQQAVEEIEKQKTAAMYQDCETI